MVSISLDVAFHDMMADGWGILGALGSGRGGTWRGVAEKRKEEGGRGKREEEKRKRENGGRVKLNMRLKKTVTPTELEWEKKPSAVNNNKY